MVKRELDTAQFKELLRNVLRFIAIFAIPVAGYATPARAIDSWPEVTSLSPRELRTEARRSLAATVGFCGVSANVSLFTAIADALPGSSYIAKTALVDRNIADNNSNYVNRALVETKNSVSTATVILGGILSIPIEILTDAVDFLTDGSLVDGDRSENQIGDQLGLGFSGSAQVLQETMGENSRCRRNAQRFEEVVYEMSQRGSLQICPAASCAPPPVQQPESPTQPMPPELKSIAQNAKATRGAR